MHTDHERASLGSVPATMIRGGTSRGLFLREDDIPYDGAARDELLLELFGSPDPLQLNGVGGGKSHLSKVMIVEPSDRPDADVDYTFAQVGVRDPEVDWSRNNGNLSSAVGAYALIEGLVAPVEPTTVVELYNTNTGTYVEQEVPVTDGEPAVYGDYAIDGVPGTGAKVSTTFRDPGGAVTGSLLPMGEPVTTFSVGGRELPASVVDSATLGVAFRAADLGLAGTELPDELAADAAALDAIERVREEVRERLDLEDAKRSNPAAVVVSAPQSYECSVDKRVSATDIDVTARFVSLQPHHAASLTGSMCLSTMTMVPGTLPNRVATAEQGSPVRIGHPKGTLAVDASVADGDPPRVESVTYRRTVCPVFHGHVYYRYRDELGET